MSTQSAVERFWSWWAQEGRERAQAALADEGDSTETEETAEAVEAHVSAMHPELEWELAPEADGRSVLVVTAAGYPEAWPVARAWLHAASDDPGWTYLDLRPPTPHANEAVIEHDGRDVELGQAVVTARRRATMVDVAVHHPVFADLDEQERAMLAYLMLDMFLGEEQSEMWLGEVSWPTMSPLDAFPMEHLPGVVADLAASHEMPGGGLGWAGLEGSTADGRPASAMVQVPLRQVTAPDLDTHCAVLVPVGDVNPDGTLGAAGIDALTSLEDRMADALGEHGRLVAHQTTPGERLFHFYLDGLDAAQSLSPVLEDWPDGRIEVEVTVDPGWGLVAHLNGSE